MTTTAPTPTTIAVIGGSPKDTELGAERLRAWDVQVSRYAVSPSPRTQTIFQNAGLEEKTATMRELLTRVQKEGAAGAYIYYNSLSGSLDLPALGQELGLPLATPLHAYREWAGQYRVLGVLAANASGHGGIERTVLSANPDLRLVQYSCLDIADAVKHGASGEDVVRKFGLGEVARLMTARGAEGIILGCTHFPAFASALAQRTLTPLFDPAEEMWRQLGSAVFA